MKESKKTESTVVEKEKVTRAEIIVTGTIDKPYYQIRYREVGKEHDNVGYGSYYLSNVFKWREECFEIIEEEKTIEEEKDGSCKCEL